MRNLLVVLIRFILIGAVLGGLMGGLMAEGMPKGPPAGAFIGAMLGLSFVALRTDTRRLMSRSEARLSSTAAEASSGFHHGATDPP